MKINKKQFYNTLFATILLLQIFLSSFRTNIIIQLTGLIIFFIFEKFLVSKGFVKIIWPLIILFLIGFLGFLIYRNAFFNALKDLFHSIKPILGITIGYLFYKKINDFKLFVKTIIICGFISAIIHFSILLLTGNIFSGSVNTMREFNKDSFLELFALFFLIYYKKFQNENLFVSGSNYRTIRLVLLASCILYFSRTMIGASIILFLSLNGYTQITTKTIKIIGGLIVFIIVFYTFLFSIKIERNKPGIETLLFKIKIAPAEIFKTNIDRENHKDLWDHWRGYEAKRAFELMNENPSSYVFGCGHGSLVNLRFFAPLSGPNEKGMKYISELHNGYPYVLYKTGTIGIILYLLFLVRLYLYTYKKRTFNNLLISSIGFFFFFSTLTITGIYNFSDIVIFILGGAIAFSEQQKQFPSIKLNKSTEEKINNNPIC